MGKPCQNMYINTYTYRLQVDELYTDYYHNIGTWKKMQANGEKIKQDVEIKIEY